MEATQFCQKCKKNIISANYMLHQAMCRGPREGQLFRSRVINPQQQLWDQGSNQIPTQNCANTNNITNNNAFKRIKSQTSQIQPQQQNNNFIPVANMNQRGQNNLQQVLPSNNLIQNQTVQNSSTQRINQQQTIQQQKIPCPNCGYKMSLIQLDTHPSQCKVKTQKCNYCGSQFPKALIRDHKTVCASRSQQQAQNTQLRRGTSQQLPRRQSNRQTLQHYHYRDQQTGQQMCARVTQDQHGNRYTDTHAVQQSTQNNNNPFSNMGAFSPILNAFFGNMFGMGGTGGMNIQMGGNNGMQRVNFMSSGFNPNSFQQMIFGLMNRMNVRPQNKVPLSKQLLNKLPIVVFDKNNADHQASTSCTVCMTDFEDGDQLIMLPCGHLFNKQCIVPWLKGSSLCPNCRQPIKSSTKPSHSNNYQANQNSQNRQPQQQSQITNNQNRNIQQSGQNITPIQNSSNIRSPIFSNPQTQYSQIPIQQNIRTNQQNIYPNLQNSLNSTQYRRN